MPLGRLHPLRRRRLLHPRRLWTHRLARPVHRRLRQQMHRILQAFPGMMVLHRSTQATSRFEHVSPPTFLDTSDVPKMKCKVSTRQVLCCRETCTVCWQALCGYSSELVRDSHFEAASVPHRCKACYRASKSSTSAGASASTSTGAQCIQ